MRILIVERFFWPDQRPHAVFFREIAERWAQDGHEVIVLTARVRDAGGERTQRRETRGGVLIRRLTILPEKRRLLVLRAINMIVLMVRALLHVCTTRRYDVVFCSTMPPVVLASGVRFAARIKRSAFVYQMMDVHPEAGVSVGVLRPGMVVKVLRRIDTQSCRGARRVVVLSDDMRSTLIERGVAPDKVLVRNNYELLGMRSDSPTAPLQRVDDEFRVLFAGNMGRAQGLEAVIAAARQLAGESRIQFHFVGDGLYRNELEQQSGDAIGKTVHFHGMVSIDAARAWMRDSDLGVICLQPGVYRTSYPSKTATYLAEGLPVLVVAEAESGIAKMMDDERVGRRADQGSADSISEGIRAAFAVRSEIEELRGRARLLCQREFDRDQTLGFWSDLILELTPDAAISREEEAA